LDEWHVRLHGPADLSEEQVAGLRDRIDALLQAVARLVRVATDPSPAAWIEVER